MFSVISSAGKTATQPCEVFFPPFLLKFIWKFLHSLSSLQTTPESSNIVWLVLFCFLGLTYPIKQDVLQAVIKHGFLLPYLHFSYLPFCFHHLCKAECSKEIYAEGKKAKIKTLKQLLSTAVRKSTNPTPSRGKVRGGICISKRSWEPVKPVTPCQVRDGAQMKQQQLLLLPTEIQSCAHSALVKSSPVSHSGPSASPPLLLKEFQLCSWCKKSCLRTQFHMQKMYIFLLGRREKY